MCGVRMCAASVQPWEVSKLGPSVTTTSTLPFVFVMFSLRTTQENRTHWDLIGTMSLRSPLESYRISARENTLSTDPTSEWIFTISVTKAFIISPAVSYSGDNQLH